MKSRNGPLRVGIGGPVGSGKTALTEKLCKAMRDDYSVAVVTNDIYTTEDAEALMRMQALPSERIVGVDIEDLTEEHIESGVGLREVEDRTAARLDRRRQQVALGLVEIIEGALRDTTAGGDDIDRRIGIAEFDEDVGTGLDDISLALIQVYALRASARALQFFFGVRAHNSPARTSVIFIPAALIHEEARRVQRLNVANMLQPHDMLAEKYRRPECLIPPPTT